MTTFLRDCETTGTYPFKQTCCEVVDFASGRIVGTKCTAAAGQKYPPVKPKPVMPKRKTYKRKSYAGHGRFSDSYSKATKQKYKNFGFGPTALSATWVGGELDPATILCLSATDQGNGMKQRVGSYMRISSIYLKLSVTAAPSESSAAPVAATQEYRLILLVDHQTNAAQLNAEDVMEIADVADQIQNFRNLENTNRFEILYDRRRVLRLMPQNEGSVNLFARSAGVDRFNIYKRFRVPLMVNYTIGTTTGVIGAVRDHSIHLIGIGQNTTILLQYEARIRFVDHY